MWNQIERENVTKKREGVRSMKSVISSELSSSYIFALAKQMTKNTKMSLDAASGLESQSKGYDHPSPLQNANQHTVLHICS